MAGAIIVANQPSGAGAGSPGVARNDLWQSQQIQLVVGTAGNSSIAWSLLDAPIGSSATLANASQSGGSYVPCTFTPDLVGTYRVQLVTNGGGPGNIQILVFRVRFDHLGTLASRGWALPAVAEMGGESNYNGNTAGWAQVFNYIFADIAANAFGGISAGQSFASNWTALLAEDASGLQTGTRVFVSSIRDFAMLDKNSAATVEFGVVGAAIGGGQWLRCLEPDPYWVTQTDWYIDDGGNVEASGLSTGAPIPMAEWQRRTNQQWPHGTGMTVHIQSDFNMLRYGTDRLEQSEGSSLALVAAPKTKILTNAAVTGVTVASPVGPATSSTSIVFAVFAKTATRATGSFITEGYLVGSYVYFPGSALNTGVYLVSAVSALSLTMATATIAGETVTTAVASIGGTDGTITIAGSVASSVGKIGIVNAGPRAGAVFTILKDLDSTGHHTARIGNVSGGAFNTTATTLQVGDTFDTWDLFTCLNPIEFIGGTNGTISIQCVTLTGGITAIATSVVLDQCLVTGNVGVSNSSSLIAYTSLITGNLVLSNNATGYSLGGGLLGDLQIDSFSNAVFSRSTMQGGQISFGTSLITGSGQLTVSSWLAQFDRTSHAATINSGSSIVCRSGATHWGQHIDTASKIVVMPGGKYVYDTNKPSISGTGTDFTLVATDYAYAQVPKSDSGSDAYIIERSAGGPSSGGGGGVLVPIRSYGIAGRQTTVDANDQVGTIVFDPSQYPAVAGKTLQLKITAVLEVSVAGQTCGFELFNISDNITVLSLSTGNTVPTIVTSSSIPVGSSAGQLPNSQKLYGLRITRTGGTSTQYVACSSSYIEATYV